MEAVPIYVRKTSRLRFATMKQWAFSKFLQSGNQDYTANRVKVYPKDIKDATIHKAPSGGIQDQFVEARITNLQGLFGNGRGFHRESNWYRQNYVKGRLVSIANKLSTVERIIQWRTFFLATILLNFTRHALDMSKAYVQSSTVLEQEQFLCQLADIKVTRGSIKHLVKRI